MVNSYLKLTKQFDKAVSDITKEFFNSINDQNYEKIMANDEQYISKD